MIFDVSAEQVERLTANQVVELLRRLVHAELLQHKIALRSSSVPAQINIPDGGEDGRVEWSGGPNQTDWLPSRFTVFQSKRGATSPKGLKAETWTKASQKADQARVLNEALVQAIEHSGAYVVVTTSAVVGTKRNERLEAIREGIGEAGHDPKRLTSVEIYDCNKLASWTNQHPAVGLWVNTLLRDVHLGGFQTHEDWSKAPEISEVPYQKSEHPRYQPKGLEVRKWRNDDASVSEEKTLEDVRQLISAFLTTKGNAIRVVGPSGFGKTRFVHALINPGDERDDALDTNQIVYCNYDDVSDRIINLSREIADSGSRALLIVDDCPTAIHTRLSEIVHRPGSNCLVVTIGVESKAEAMRGNLVVQLKPASDAHIADIACAVHKRAKGRNEAFVRDLAQGFPRMAVFAARALEDKDFELNSVEALVSRIVWGEREENASALESLQLLSLFTLVGVEGGAASELDQVAKFAGREAETIFRDLALFTDTGVVHRQGDYAEVQPFPLAMRLANMWLETRPVGALESLFRSLDEDLKLRIVGRLRWVSWSEKVRVFAQALIKEALPGLADFDTEFGSKLLDRFVHLAPDNTMDHLHGLLGDKSIDELRSFESGRRYVLWALEKLVFRHQSFVPAARLLLRLAAAETETWSNNATGQFKSLFQLKLSGTEANPQAKLMVLDEGLKSKDQRTLEICLDALDNMLQTGHFSRSGGSENIGADEALDDWQPKTYGEIFDYYREALKRLEQITLSDNTELAKNALNSIGSHLRGLLSIQALFPEVQDLIGRLMERHLYWQKPLKAVNQWLYYDRGQASEDYQAKLRDYYDELLPNSDLDLLQVYCSGWAADLKDPDVRYNRGGENDHHYCEKKMQEIVERSSTDAIFFFPLLKAFSKGDFNSCWMTIDKVASHVTNPVELCRYLVSRELLSEEPQKLATFIESVISGARKTDRLNALACLNCALAHPPLMPHAVGLIASAGLDDELMKRVVKLLDEGQFEAHTTVAIGFADALKDISPQLVVDLLDKLQTRGSDGAWASIEFINRMLHGKRIETAPFVRVLCLAVVNHALFKRDRFSNMDWYYWHELAGKLLENGKTEPDFVEDLLSFILSVTEIQEFNVQLSFDEYAQKILRKLIDVEPELVWQKFHEQLARSDALGKYRLNNLFEGGIGNPTSAGVLNDVPLDISVAWMLEDKTERLPFILQWIELFVGEGDACTWFEIFIEFVDEHLGEISAMDAVTSRLTTGSWMGSYANKLEKEKERLLQLKHLTSSPLVQHWVEKTVSRFDQAVLEERRRDANRDADFKK